MSFMTKICDFCGGHSPGCKLRGRASVFLFLPASHWQLLCCESLQSYCSIIITVSVNITPKQKRSIWTPPLTRARNCLLFLAFEKADGNIWHENWQNDHYRASQWRRWSGRWRAASCADVGVAGSSNHGHYLASLATGGVASIALHSMWIDLTFETRTANPQLLRSTTAFKLAIESS